MDCGGSLGGSLWGAGSWRWKEKGGGKRERKNGEMGEVSAPPSVYWRVRFASGLRFTSREPAHLSGSSAFRRRGGAACVGHRRFARPPRWSARLSLRWTRPRCGPHADGVIDGFAVTAGCLTADCLFCCVCLSWRCSVGDDGDAIIVVVIVTTNLPWRCASRGTTAPVATATLSSSSSS